MTSRVFIGNLNRRANERDVERFFKGFGKIQDVILKTGFGFVDFADNRDAEDAVYEMNGKDLCGDRVTVEMSRPRGEGGSRGRGGRGGYEDRGGGYRGGGDRGGYGGRDFGRDNGDNRRTGKPPNLTEYRVTVENLSSKVSWQELKDLMNKAGDVTFADAHKRNDNSGIVCFATMKDMKRAIEKYDGYDLNGRKIKMVQEYKEKNGGSRSRSRSRSDRSRSKGSDKRSASRSRSASSHDASHSSKSKSVSPPPANDD